MAELTQVVNGRYIGADKYTITDTSDGKKQVVFSPDTVLEEGTPVGAELLNEIQKNGLYYLTGTHRVSGQEDIYDCTLEGIDTFEFTQLNVLFKPNVVPTQPTVKLNVSGQVYTLTGKILSANQIGLILVKSELKAYTWASQVEIVNDLTTGGADKALSGEMGKKLNTDKQNKTDSRLKTDSKEIVGAINESLWSIGYKALSTVNDFNELTQSGIFHGRAETGVLNSPFPPPFNFILINYNHGGLIEQKIISGADYTVVRKQVGTRWYNWEKTLRTNTKEFLGNAGISSIIYIQDSGTKTKDNGYIDKATGKLYIAKETNTDVTVTKKFRLATNIENAKEPLSIDVYTKKSVSVNTELTIIPESELSNYSQFDEIEFIADNDGTGQCSSHKVTIGAVLKAYDTVSGISGVNTSKGRVTFLVPDINAPVEIKKKVGVGIVMTNVAVNWYLANCRIIKKY